MKKEKVLESDDSKLTDDQVLLRAYKRLWKLGKVMSKQESDYMEIHNENLKRKSKRTQTGEETA